MTRAECEHLGCLATPEQIADAYAKTGIPEAPDVRRCVEEMRELDTANPHTPAGSAAIAALSIACLLAGIFL
jgi:hypothetical protein